MEDTNLWIFKNKFHQKVHKRYLHNVHITILVWIEIKFIANKKWKVRSAMLVLQRNMFMYICTCPCLRLSRFWTDPPTKQTVNSRREDKLNLYCRFSSSWNTPTTRSHPFHPSFWLVSRSVCFPYSNAHTLVNTLSLAK